MTSKSGWPSSWGSGHRPNPELDCLPEQLRADTLRNVVMDASAYVELKPNRNIPAFRAGDTVRVHATVAEGERRRIQVFEGVVIRVKGGGINSSFTVRRVSHSIGVERVFPYYSPLVDKVEVTRVGKVRRARLYYLRERVGKAARLKPGARSRFEKLQLRPMSATEVDKLMAEADAAVAVEEDLVENEAVVTAEEAAVEEATEEATEIVAEVEAPTAETEAPTPEAKAVVEEPATPEAAEIEETIQTESGEEPGEATGDK